MKFSKVLLTACALLALAACGTTRHSSGVKVSDIPSAPYGNEMACVVVDAQEQRVVYYCKQTPTFASHPKDNEDVSKLLHKLLKDFIR